MEIKMTTSIEAKEYWQQQLDKFKASNLSRSKFCRENSIDYHKFSYWIKKSKLSPTLSEFVPIKLQISEGTTQHNHTALCSLELRDHVLRIHDLSVLSFILERLS
jgi:hypothetical protein